MKVLIGTPIHDSKDYAMERWLKNVAAQDYPANLFMIDNSIGNDYVNRVKEYCAKLRIHDYKVTHIELAPDQDVHQRVTRCREVIRKEVRDNNYDAWFSWECDQIIPPDGLNKLVKAMEAGDYMMLNHNGWGRENSELPITDFGVSLIRKDCLEKFSFLPPKNDNSRPAFSWETSEAWYKRQVMSGGGNYLEVYGLIDPIEHLDNPNK